MTSDIKPTQNTNVLHYLCKKCYKQYQLSVLLMKKKIATKPKGEGSLQIKHCVVIVGPYTVNPLLSLPRGNLFQAHLRRGGGGGLNREERLIWEVSVLHKELEYKVEKINNKVRGHAAEDQNQVRA